MKDYVVTVTVAAASTAAEMATFGFGALGAAVISGTDITIDAIVRGARSARIGCLRDRYPVNKLGRWCDNRFRPR